MDMDEKGDLDVDGDMDLHVENGYWDTYWSRRGAALLWWLAFISK